MQSTCPSMAVACVPAMWYRLQLESSTPSYWVMALTVLLLGECNPIKNSQLVNLPNLAIAHSQSFCCLVRIQLQFTSPRPALHLLHKSVRELHGLTRFRCYREVSAISELVTPCSKSPNATPNGVKECLTHMQKIHSVTCNSFKWVLKRIWDNMGP